jgi:acyl-CoA thioester hydrolase
MSKQPHAFTLPVRVYFQDTDAGGVVYHANYANFLERARADWLRERHGYGSAALMKEFGVVFVVRSLKLDYLRPALLDDLLAVTVQVKELGRSRVVLHQTVMRGEEMLVEAEVHLVCVTTDVFKPVVIPDALRNQWKA